MHRGEGLEPDVVVENRFLESLGAGVDTDLAKALEEVKTL
jgi:hypothetical protein